METKKKGNTYYYQDRKFKIKLNTKNVYSKGMFENVCLAIKVALDLNIDKKTIQKTLPLLLLLRVGFSILIKVRLKISWT